MRVLGRHLRKLRRHLKRCRKRLIDWSAWFWHRLFGEPGYAERFVALTASAIEMLAREPAMRRLAWEVARVLTILLRAVTHHRDLDGGDLAWP